MTLEKKIRDLILHYVRVKYNSYLSKHNIFIINDNEIDNVINSLYNNEKTDLINFIQNSLTFEKNSYSKSVVDNLISDIFKDNDLCKNRLRKEINQYQSFKEKNKTIYENSYDVVLTPDSKCGLGIELAIKQNNAFIKNFKKGTNNIILPAEKSGLIKLNSQILEINYETLLGRNSDDIVKLLSLLTERTVILKIK